MFNWSYTTVHVAIDLLNVQSITEKGKLSRSICELKQTLKLNYDTGENGIISTIISELKLKFK